MDDTNSEYDHDSDYCMFYVEYIIFSQLVTRNAILEIIYH